MNTWLRACRLIDALNGHVGRWVSWLILIMTVISALNAVTRKAFNFSSNAFLEIQWYLFAAVFLLAAGYTLLRNEHVRVDIVSARASTHARLWIELCGTLFFLLPFAVLVVYFGWPYFVKSLLSQEWSLNAGGLIVWPVKLLIPLGFLLLFLQGLSQLVKLVAALRGAADPAPLLERHSAQEAEVKVLLGSRKEA